MDITYENYHEENNMSRQHNKNKHNMPRQHSKNKQTDRQTDISNVHVVIHQPTSALKCRNE